MGFPIGGGNVELHKGPMVDERYIDLLKEIHKESTKFMCMYIYIYMYLETAVAVRWLMSINLKPWKNSNPVL